MKKFQLLLKNLQETAQLAAKISVHQQKIQHIHLLGGLGVGKTAFCRSFIKALGYNEHVKSPTYNIVETYSINNSTIYHFDLYRLSDPNELTFIGIRDYLNQFTTFLVEWPENGIDVLPKADLEIHFSYCNESDSRLAQLIAGSNEGLTVLQSIMV